LKKQNKKTFEIEITGDVEPYELVNALEYAFNVLLKKPAKIEVIIGKERKHDG